MSDRKQLAVFSDLDGSLLDHDTYSFHAAKTALETLRANNIPLVLVSSKTRAEIEGIRVALGNDQPFIVENGACVFVPKNVCGEQPPGTDEKDGYWVYESSAPREHWLGLIDEVGTEFIGEFQTFFAAGTSGIREMTGLSEVESAAANQRDYSEPVAWLGSDANKQKFVLALEAAGASVQQGGRFLSVSGDCDKGRALIWLRQQFVSWYQADAVVDIAIGDSGNDVAMLEVAGTALLIRSPKHPFPSLDRTEAVMRSEAFGPAGWAEGVMNWLKIQKIF